MRKINFSSTKVRLGLLALVLALGAGAFYASWSLRVPLAVAWQDAILDNTELPQAELENGDPNKDALLLLALSEDRGDAVVRLLNNGVDANISGNIVLWATLQNWSLENSEASEDVIAAYAQNGGDFNVTLQGMTPMEAASTVSLAALGALIDNGVSPWSNPDAGPGILTRLSLHSELPNVLTIIEHVVMKATTPAPDVWERDVVVGNLVDHYDRLRAEGISHGLDESGEPTGTPDETISQIARIVLHVAHENEGPWHLIPQEFLDLEKADLI
jgi:hypothetical protein